MLPVLPGLYSALKTLPFRRPTSKALSTPSLRKLHDPALFSQVTQMWCQFPSFADMSVFPLILKSNNELTLLLILLLVFFFSRFVTATIKTLCLNAEIEKHPEFGCHVTSRVQGPLLDKEGKGENRSLKRLGPSSCSNRDKMLTVVDIEIAYTCYCRPHTK